ncbi:MAG: carbon-nitrogen hydrolase [Phototrophicales bacterium]|nr:MAG: carbon-nitrogen hydrolase [Phototrophicales bacterium]
MANLRVALAQIDIKKGNPRANWARVQEAIAEAHRQRAHVVLLPELWDAGFDLERAKDFASSLSGGLFSELAAISAKATIYILGSMLEKRGLGVSNTAPIVSPKRGIEGAYRKVHLFPLMEEDRWLTPGEAATTFDLPWGRTGVAICYDLRFPELFRRYAVEGARITFLPAQWPIQRIEHFRALLKARAIENQMYIVATNRVGMDDYEESTGNYSTQYGGHSTIIDPNGDIVIELGTGEAVVTAEVDLNKVEMVRRSMPILEDRRPEIYI